MIEFENKHKRIVIAAYLKQINLRVMRSPVIRLNISGIGVIKTHGKKKNLKKIKKVKRGNRKTNKKIKTKRLFSEKHLLF